MSYRYDKQKKQRKQRFFVVAILLMVAFFTPAYTWIFDTIERPLARGWESRNNTFDGTENFFQAFYGKKQILKKNKELGEEIERLKIDNMRVSYLSQERDTLYQIKEMNNTLLPAHVLHHGIIGNSDVLLINQGINNSITIGSSVFAYNNILIGYVSEVYDSTSEVTLYTKNGEKIFGVLYPQERTLEAKGQGKGGFMIETPREVEAAVGDILYSMNENGSIIAVVRDIVFDPRDPFKQVYLSYPININQIQNVGIKLNK